MMPLFTTVLPITIIAASWITYCIMGIIWKRRDKRFIAFLTENADELLSGGGCEFEGVEYRKETRVTRFYCCMSVIFLTYMEQSGFVLTDGSAGTKALCILLALTGGWWGFPWGPIRTVQSVYKTCTADSMTVYDILEKLSLAQDISIYIGRNR